jgi:hypothetical protein
MTTPNTPGWYPDPQGSGTQRFWDGEQWSGPSTSESPAPPAPAAFEYAAPADDGRAKLIRNYCIAVAAGLALLVTVALWGTFHTPTPVKMGSPSGGITEETVDIGESIDPSSESIEDSADAPIAADGPVDANLQFFIDTIESTSTVTSPTNEYLTKDAQGEFIVVYLLVTNIGSEPAYYMANLQRLYVGTDAYPADPEASYYLGSSYEEIPPGGEVESALVFDVPVGSVPDALEVHGDAITEGTVVPLQ